MSEQRDLTQRGGEIIRGALHDVRAEVDLDGEQARAVGAAMINVLKEGVRLGVAEVSAHVIEQGIDLDLHMDVSDEKLTGDDLRP